jgi:cytosine/adenosine deaminase-related metal-dependent hydrolase
MATAGSAAGLGREADLGHLEPGAAGDLVCYDVTGPFDVGVADPIAGLLWAGPGRKPKHVVVGGRVVVDDGRLVTGDARQIVEDLRAELRRRHG